MDEAKETMLMERGTNALEYVQKLEVKDESGKAAANNALSLIKDIQKEIKDYFAPTIKKAHDLHKDLLNKQKGFLDPLKKAEDVLKPKLTAYLQEQERIRQEALRKAQEDERKRAEEARKDPLAPPPAPVAPAIPEAPRLDGFHVRTNWKWRVIDFDKIPREYLTTNDTKINSTVTKMKEKTDIPGIQAYPEESLSKSRGKQDPY